MELYKSYLLRYDLPNGLLPPLNMNKMKIFNLVYKIKIPKTEKSCMVDRLNPFPHSPLANMDRSANVNHYHL